ncbi:hypothetical protein [Fervidobacterium thailandense]|uniref:hypothetical protein n=1 Tax=Fervidobacterium thailandense TaxID=1008305 RepID=UPI001112FE6A|nr:hypothetical protein [Fervidobacterium thailandense]
MIAIFSLSVQVYANALKMANEGAGLLKRSKSALFPLNIILFYSGVFYLTQAVSNEPTNLDVRLVRAMALFDFAENNPLAQDTVLEDLEFFLMFRNRYPYSTKVELPLVYFALAYVSGLKKDFARFYYYLDRLRECEEMAKYLSQLKQRFPQLVK